MNRRLLRRLRRDKEWTQEYLAGKRIAAALGTSLGFLCADNVALDLAVRKADAAPPATAAR